MRAYPIDNMLLMTYVQDQKPNCSISYLWAYNMGQHQLGQFAVTIQTVKSIKEVKTQLHAVKHHPVYIHILYN